MSGRDQHDLDCAAESRQTPERVAAYSRPRQAERPVDDADARTTIGPSRELPPMPERKTANVHDLETREADGIDPRIRAVGYELRPEKMRPSVWVYEAGESNNRHYQREQEELYHVLSGRFEMTVDDETLELGAGDVVVVEPEAVRQLTCREAGEVFVVGAPNVKDDGVVLDDEA